ncbi:hypothetical protein D3C80_1879950 [compost metagenome]
MHHGRVLADLIGHLRLKIAHRGIGNVLTRLRRHGKATDIFLREEAGRQSLEQIKRCCNRCQECAQNHAAMGKAPADGLAIEAKRALEAGVEPTDDGRRSGGMTRKP